MIEFSPGGSLIAVQSAQGLLRLWRFSGFTADKQTAAGAPPPGVKPAGEWRTMASVKNGFHPVCVTGDKALALRMAPAAGYPGGALILLHLESDTERIIVDNPGPEDFFAVNPVRETCAVYHDGTLTIRNLGFLDVVATIEFPSRITRCEWQENGERILAGCANGNVMLYSMFNGFTIPLNCLRHNAPVCRAAFAGPELTIVSASDEGFTRVFTAVTNQVHLEMRGVTGHRFNRNGTRLAAVDGSLRMLLWDKRSPVGVTKISGVVSSRFESWEIDYAKKSGLLLMDSDPNLMVKDGPNRVIGGTAMDGRKRGASFTPDESSVVIIDENGFSTMNLISLAALGGPAPFSIIAPVAGDPAWMPRRFCFAANGTLALEGVDNRYGTARWPDLTAVRELKGPRASALDGPGGSPGGSGTLAVSPEGAWIAGGFPESGPAVIWNALTGDIVKELPHQGSVHFSPDGRWFLLGGESQWRLYATGSWKEQWSRPRHGFARQLAVSAFAGDGRSLVMDTDTFQLTLLETESGKPLASLPLPEPISTTSVRYDSTRGTIHAGSRSNNIYRWDLPVLRAALKKLKIEPRF
jgi:WD40 repeat protein